MKKLTIVLLLALCFNGVFAQTPEIEKYKSLFTLNFIRYIGWPEEALQGDFVIGVLKNSALAKEFKAQTEGKKFGFQPIVIKEFKSIEEVTDCQILYIDDNINYNKNATMILKKISAGSLIVTEDDGAIAFGSMINFVIVDDKLKFEVSTANATKKGLTFSNTILSMTSAIKS